MISSAGWKSSRTAMPALAQRRLVRPEGQAGAEQRSDVHVVAAGVADAGTSRPRSRSVRSRTGGASRSARRATRYAGCSAPRSATRPVPGSGRTRMPAAASRWPTAGGARLLAGQLGVGVQVPLQLDELGREGVDAVADGRQHGFQSSQDELYSRRARAADPLTRRNAELGVARTVSRGT